MKAGFKSSKSENERQLKPKKKKRRQKNAKNVLLEAENKNLIPAFQGAKVAYTVLKRNNNTEHNLYEYVLFLVYSELAEIISLLRRFTESDLTHDELLSHIENTWHMILGRYEGEDIKEYTDWTLAQIHEKVFGLPMQASFLNSIKLKQVKDLDRETANKHIQFFDYSYNVLNIILRRGGNYDYSFINDRDIYYWILERELP